MNVKGGVAYIDFKGGDIYSANTYVIQNIFSTVKKAYDSKKVFVIHNSSASGEILNDVTPFSVRKRDNNKYVFSISISNAGVSGVTARYIVISNDDTVTVY